jgi:hypothetical protein
MALYKIRVNAEKDLEDGILIANSFRILTKTIRTTLSFFENCPVTADDWTCLGETMDLPMAAKTAHARIGPPCGSMSVHFTIWIRTRLVGFRNRSDRNFIF